MPPENAIDHGQDSPHREPSPAARQNASGGDVRAARTVRLTRRTASPAALVTLATIMVVLFGWLLDIEALMTMVLIVILAGTIAWASRALNRIHAARREAQAELRNSREFFSQILHCIRDPIFVVDDQHRFVLTNTPGTPCMGGGGGKSWG